MTLRPVENSPTSFAPGVGTECLIRIAQRKPTNGTHGRRTESSWRRDGIREGPPRYDPAPVGMTQSVETCHDRGVLATAGRKRSEGWGATLEAGDAEDISVHQGRDRCRPCAGRASGAGRK